MSSHSSSSSSHGSHRSSSRASASSSSGSLSDSLSGSLSGSSSASSTSSSPKRVRESLPAALYVVATPIGNLSDMVPRAVEILQAVSVIAAEDTRHSAPLMQRFQIDTPMLAYHDHSDQSRIDQLLSRLEQGESVAIISDAGTPLISDPGYRLVHQARQRGFRVVPVPGACALVSALSASGLPTHTFTFEGFPPHKAGARQKMFAVLAQEARTLVFYESPHRIVSSLSDMVEAFSANRPATFAREITKTFETFIHGTLSTILEAVTSDLNNQKGEMVVVVQGYEPPVREGLNRSERDIMHVLMDELPLKQASAIAAKITGQKKNVLYKWAIDQKTSDSDSPL